MNGSTPGLELAQLMDLSHVGGTGTDSGDTVRAVVGGGCALQSLIIDDDLLDRGAKAVADAVLEAVRAAQSDAAQHVSTSIRSPDDASVSSVMDAAQHRLGEMMSDLESLTRRLAQQ